MWSIWCHLPFFLVQVLTVEKSFLIHIFLSEEKRILNIVYSLTPSQSLKEMEICLHKMRTVELKTPAWCQGRNSWETKVFAPFPPLSNLRTEPRMIISLTRSVRGTSRAKETWEQISPPFQFSHLLQSLVPPSPWYCHWLEIYNILLK